MKKTKQIIFNILFILFLLPSSYYAQEDKIPDNIIKDLNDIYIKHGFAIKGTSSPKSSSLQGNSPDKPAKANLINKIKCSTPLIRDLNIYISKQEEHYRPMIRKYLRMRPTDGGDEDYYGNGVVVKTYTTAHFLIHYVDTPGNTHVVDLTDLNSNVIPDIIENYSYIVEECWNKEVTELGFNKPVLENGELFDVYILDLQDGPNYLSYAYTVTDPYANHPIQSKCYIVMDNNYIDSLSYPGITESNYINLIKVIFAHEFFHAIQNAYNSYGDLWFSEACSTWVEDIVYNEVNDYRTYLDDFYSHTEYTLEHNSSEDSYYVYGALVFPRYLNIKYGTNIIKKTFESMSTDTRQEYDIGVSLTSIKFALNDEQLLFDNVLGDFRVASFLVGQNYSTTFAANYYKDEESRDFNVVPKVESLQYPFDIYSPDIKFAPQYSGVNYILITPANSNSVMTLKFSGNANARWGGKIIKYKYDNSLDVENIAFENNRTAYITVSDFGNIYSKVILVVYVTYGSNDIRYSYTLSNFNPDNIPPQNVHDISVNPFDDSNLKLSWANPEDKDFAGVIILRNDSKEILEDYVDRENNIVVFEDMDTTFIDNGLTAGKTYYYKIFAYDSAQNNSSGVSASGTVNNDITSPPQINVLTVQDDNSNGQVNLDWSTYDYPLDIANYAIYYDTSDFAITTNAQYYININADTTKYSVKGLTNNVLYYFAVSGIDKTGNENQNVFTKSAKPTWDYAAPDQITELYTVPGGGSGKIILNWVNYSQPKDLRYYRIYKNSQSFTNVEAMSFYNTTLQKNCTIENLTNNTNYYFAVTAVDINYNENKNVISVKAIPREYQDFSIAANTENINVFIDGNYAYSGKWIGIMQSRNSIFNEIAKKHFLMLRESKGIYMDAYGLVDNTLRGAQVNIKMQNVVNTEYRSSSKLLTAQDELSAPFVVDWDNDGKKDLIVGTSLGEIYFYHNIGTDASPELDKSKILFANGKIIDVGEEAVPFVVDWNNDSKKDLIVGTKNGKICFFENIGDDENPEFNDSTIIYQNTEKSIAPFVVDLDDDRDKDIIFGTAKGEIYFLENIGSDENPSFSSGKKIEDVSALDGYSVPFLINWNHLGKKDIVIGNSQGSAQVFYSSSTSMAQNFFENFDFIKASGNNVTTKSGRAHPFIVDWNNDNKWDVIIGEENGDISIYYGAAPVVEPPDEPNKICFLTEIFGDKNKTLLEIRDKFLLNSNYGNKFVEFYYKILNVLLSF
ncbi:hypothetical protein HZA55_03140 [Candidatus Poribacteria bacterium]|nr:hypothetical protein [Candidatus Poribacteria bacterium]